MKYLLIIFLIVSCGTRKTSQQKSTFKSDSLSIENTRVLKQNIELRDIHSIKPFDALKPMIIDGKSYFNVIITKDKSKINKTEDKTENKVSSIKKESEVKIKESEKTDNTILYIGLFFVLIIGVLALFKLPSFRKGI